MFDPLDANRARSVMIRCLDAHVQGATIEELDALRRLISGIDGGADDPGVSRVLRGICELLYVEMLLRDADLERNIRRLLTQME